MLMQSDLCPPDFPYLVRKKIKPHKLKINDGKLLIPLINKTGKITGLQMIDANGQKRFITNTAKKGSFWVLGKMSDIILICEGFATAASLNENTGFATVIAFDAGNLIHVAPAIKSIEPSRQIIIAGDNDKSGTGQKKAAEAATLVNGQISIPPSFGDWNDYFCGLEEASV
jgi:putative DNA primase/helicase